MNHKIVNINYIHYLKTMKMMNDNQVLKRNIFSVDITYTNVMNVIRNVVYVLSASTIIFNYVRRQIN